jgi:hypothetical protein
MDGRTFMAVFSAGRGKRIIEVDRTTVPSTGFAGGIDVWYSVDELLTE